MIDVTLKGRTGTAAAPFYALSIERVTFLGDNVPVDGETVAILSPDGDTLALGYAEGGAVDLNLNTAEADGSTAYLESTETIRAALVVGDTDNVRAIVGIELGRNVLDELAPPPELTPKYPTSESLLAILAQMTAQANRAEEASERAESAEASQVAKRAEEKAEVAEQIAKGAQYAKIFTTEAEMKTWAAAEMAKPAEEREVKVGDNLYITDRDVPDYWWTGEGDGYSQLETGAVKIEVDDKLSNTSKNPVQNKTVYEELKKKQNANIYTAKMSLSATPNETYKDALVAGAMRLLFDNTNVESLLLQSKDNEMWISWYTGSGIVTCKLGGDASPMEVWRGNVGFGAQDVFFGAKKTADGDGQFQKGYPRLHGHGQDIHEVSGFSRDSYEGETVWSHRLLLPWDLAKANDTSYLMAAVIWESTRLGVNAKFVQPLLPTNTAEATAALGLPYALPCFENSPIYWNGHLIFDDGSGVKQITFPWGAVNANTTAKVPVLLSSSNDLRFLDDDRRELVIYSNGSGGYVHTKEMGSSTSKAFSFVTQALLDRISALEKGRYAFVNLQYTSSAITLQSKSINIIECASAPSGSVLHLKTSYGGTSANEFMMVLKNVTDLTLGFYPSLTILPRDGDGSHLVPEAGTNVFQFNEIMPGNFLVSRTLV